VQETALTALCTGLLEQTPMVLLASGIYHVAELRRQRLGTNSRPAAAANMGGVAPMPANSL